jgi:endonuclease/exonuclease/phosphatase family metal-dependent hydrolase
VPDLAAKRMLVAEFEGKLMSEIGAAARRFASAATEMPPIRVVTYNIHGCVGLDRRYDPARIAAVLSEIDADIACLQEVDARRGGLRAEQAAYLGEATGRQVILGAAHHRGRFANAILTRFPALAARTIDLAVPRYEPRGAIDVDLLIGGRILRVMATHFGLHAGERRLQANRLVAALGEPAGTNRVPPHAVLLVGDLNEWRGRNGGGIRALDRCLGPSAMPRTFPSWMPVLPLDRIYALGPAVLSEIEVCRSPLARVASDHLPLIGNLSWSNGQRHRHQRVRAPCETPDSYSGPPWATAAARPQPGLPWLAGTSDRVASGIAEG